MLERLALGRAAPRPRWRPQWYAYLSIAPALILVALFAIYPLAFSVRLATHRYVLTDPASHPFEGLRNFAEVLSSYYFRRAALTTLTFTAPVVGGAIALGGAGSPYPKPRGPPARVLRIAILLTSAHPVALAGLIWKWL